MHILGQSTVQVNTIEVIPDWPEHSINIVQQKVAHYWSKFQRFF